MSKSDIDEKRKQYKASKQTSKKENTDQVKIDNFYGKKCMSKTQVTCSINTQLFTNFRVNFDKRITHYKID